MHLSSAHGAHADARPPRANSRRPGRRRPPTSGSTCEPSAALRPKQQRDWSLGPVPFHAEAELSLRIDRSVCPGRPLPKKLGLLLDAFPLSPLAGRASRALRDRPRLPQGPEALGPRAALGGAAGLARDEDLHRVHLRRIRDANLFEDGPQLLAERVARFLGLPNVDDAESTRAFAG